MRTIDTGTDEILTTVEDNIATITMNNPKLFNAMSGEMIGCMNTLLGVLEQDNDVHCIVLTGAGKAFSSGGDIKGMVDAGDGFGAISGDKSTVDRAIHTQRIDQIGTSGRLFKMPKPTLAAINGSAAGAGLSWGLACDMRIMSSSAFMTTGFAKIAFSGDYGGTYFLTQLVGPAKAKELYFLSDRIDADEALRLGLTNFVCKPEELVSKTREIALRLAEGPSVAYRYIKENINRALDADLEECMNLEATHHVHSGQTEDHHHAIRSFVNKEKPTFKGK